MLFGHNSNVKAGDTTYHVQTEDRGTTNALIDTTVYFHGRVLHRRTNNYFDLLPLNPDTEQALKLRLDEQHHTVSRRFERASCISRCHGTKTMLRGPPPQHPRLS